MKANNRGGSVVFLLMRAISQVVSASWTRSAPPSLVLLASVSSLAETCKRQQILRTRWIKKEQKEERPEATWSPPRLHECLFSFSKRFSSRSLSPVPLSSSKAWQRRAWRGSELVCLPSQSSRGHTDVLLRTRRHQRGEERSRGFPLFTAPLSPLEGSSDGIKVRHHRGHPRNVSPALCRL